MKKRTPETKEIYCEDCGKLLILPWQSKIKLCDKCRAERAKHHFKIIKEQKILCKREDCSNVVKVVLKKGSTIKEEIHGPVLCDYHKTREYEIIPQRRTCRQCGKTLGYVNVKKVYQTRETKPWRTCEECKAEERKENSERMKNNNPMYNPETASKVARTLEKNWREGEYKKVTGPEHWLYKGNKELYSEARRRLYTIWVKPILERDNFKCTRCGCDGNLQVHHLKPFRDIIEEVLKEYNLDNKKVKREDIGDDLYEDILNKILKSHKIEYGVTLCKKCHEEVDYRYRPFKGLSKNRKDKEENTNENLKD